MTKQTKLALKQSKKEFDEMLLVKNTSLFEIDCKKFKKLATINIELLINAIKNCEIESCLHPIPLKFKKSFRGCLLTIEASNGKTLDLSITVSDYIHDKYSGKENVDIANYPFYPREVAYKYSVPYTRKFEKIYTQPYYLIKILKGIQAKEVEIFVLTDDSTYNGSGYYAFKGSSNDLSFYQSITFIQSTKEKSYLK